MSKIFVIAGTDQEAKSWIKQDLDKRYDNGETSLTLSHYWIVSNAVNLKGVSDPHGVFVGTWRKRPDITEIIETMIICSKYSNATLKKLREEFIDFTECNWKPSMVMIKKTNDKWDIFDTNPLPLQWSDLSVQLRDCQKAHLKINRKINGRFT